MFSDLNRVNENWSLNPEGTVPGFHELGLNSGRGFFTFEVINDEYRPVCGTETVKCCGEAKNGENN